MVRPVHYLPQEPASPGGFILCLDGSPVITGPSVDPAVIHLKQVPDQGILFETGVTGGRIPYVIMGSS